MLLHAATIFLSAFLLFLVQPVLAKQILPWFGGAAVVWTTCMVFFQFVLLLGYAYSHWITSRVDSPRQNWIHIGAARGEPRLPADPARRRAGSPPATRTRSRASSCCSSRPSGCPTSCCPRRARSSRPGSRASSRVRAPTGSSRCPTSPRCWRSWATPSSSSRGSRARSNRGPGPAATCCSWRCAPGSPGEAGTCRRSPAPRRAPRRPPSPGPRPARSSCGWRSPRWAR